MRFVHRAVLAASVLVAHGAIARDDSDAVFARAHARRGEVNSRLNLQHQRIRHEVLDGKITRSQATALHDQDEAIRGEERSMAGQNGGRLTKSDQRILNQQEGSERQELQP